MWGSGWLVLVVVVGKIGKSGKQSLFNVDCGDDLLT